MTKAGLRTKFLSRIAALNPFASQYQGSRGVGSRVVAKTKRPPGTSERAISETKRSSSSGRMWPKAPTDVMTSISR